MKRTTLLFGGLFLHLLAAAVANAQAVRSEPGSRPASEAPMSAGELAEVKSLMRAELDHRMIILARLRDCVKAAPDKAQIKVCQDQERGAMRQLIDAMRAGTYESK